MELRPRLQGPAVSLARRSLGEGGQSAVPKRAVWKPPLLVYALARLVVGG